MNLEYLDNKRGERLEDQLARLNDLRPLPGPATKKLREKLRVEMTYNSNSIEGNSLTLKETFLVINEGITVKGKPLKDHLETKDHYAALGHLYDLVDQKKPISVRLIKNLHKVVLKGTDGEWAGAYRTSGVVIGGSDHTPPDAAEVPSRMKGLVEWVNSSKLHVLELASLLHHKIVYIHPFLDGNGRTARIVMNLLLMQEGFPLSIILKNDHKKYYEVLDRADKGDYEPLVSFIARTVERSLNIYLRVLSEEKYLKLSELAPKTPYSAKYLNLLARKGKISAHKEGRLWVSTEEAVQRYIDNRDRDRDL